MSKVDEFKDRVVKMLEEGCTRFGWTTGPRWHELSTEEKCAAILEVWDAPKVPSEPPRTTKPQIDVRELVEKLRHA